MKRILLASSNLCDEPHAVYPLGMAVLAGALETSGFAVRQFDLLASGDSRAAFRQLLDAFRPDVVGISVRNLDSTDSLHPDGGEGYLEGARRLVAETREWSAIPVVIGGPAVSILPAEVLACTGADYAIVGEGERAFDELLRGLAAGQSNKPVFERGVALTASELHAPAHDPQLLDFYRNESNVIGVETKRGCPFRCAYCTYPLLSGRSFRIRPPEDVVDELEMLSRRHHISTFFFTDPVFNERGGSHLAIAEELIRRDLRIRWAAYFTPANLGREELALCKLAGLYAVELGTDAATDTTLRGMNKPFRFTDVRAANEACVAEELPCAHFVIFGGPGETLETVEEGISNLDELEHCVVLAVLGARIYPGTPLHGKALEEGCITPETDLSRATTYVSSTVLASEIEDLLKRTWAHRRDRLFPPTAACERQRVLRRMGMKGMLWDQLIRF